MKYKVFFFDLDDTIYQRSSGLWPEIGHRIDLYIERNLKLPMEEVSSLRRRLFEKYGTTLRGLQHEFHIDTFEYLEYVHDVPLSNFLKPTADLHKLLSQITIQKIIFTNADRAHAERVLKTLGVNDCFESIIDILTIAPYCKPQSEAFEIALSHAGEIKFEECIFIDDSLVNLNAARALGLTTIHLCEDSKNSSNHQKIQNLLELPNLVPEIFA